MLPDLTSELRFQTSRSSGPGGQNVNKVESRVEVRLSVPASRLLTDEQKERIFRKLSSALTEDGDLVVTEQRTRSQLKNKELAVQKLNNLLEKAFRDPKPRKATQPTRASAEERLQRKRISSERKASRQRKNWED